MLHEQVQTVKNAARKKRKRVIFALASVVVLCAGGTFAYMQYGQQSQPLDLEKNTVTVSRGSIDLSISASGTIRPENEVKISPKVTGLLKRLLVVQGQRVKKGDVIALMDDSNIIGQVEAARAAAQLARANYDKALHGNRPQEIAEQESIMKRAREGVRFFAQALNRAKAQVKSRQAELVRDDTNAGRMTQLAGQGAVSDQERLNAVTAKSVTAVTLEQAQQELRQAEVAQDQAVNDYETAKQRFELLKAGSREEDIRAQLQAMNQAQGNLKWLESQLNDMKIKAPFSGVISMKFADEGAIVTPTTSAATTSATSSSIVSLAGRLEMVAYVSETDMEHLKVGQPAKIIANAYPDKVFHGKVTLIAPAAVVTQNVTTFEVHTSIDDDPKGLLMAGMNVDSELLAGKLDDVVLVPTVAVISEKGKTGVLIPDEEGKPKFKPIKTGHTSGNKTMVYKGLKENDKVFLALNKEELEKRGYTESGGGRGMGMGGGGRKGGGGNLGIPRSFRNRH